VYCVYIFNLYMCICIHTSPNCTHTTRKPCVLHSGSATTLQNAVAHCNTLQHTAAHCSTLQHTSALRVGDPPFPRPFHIFFSNPRIAECCTTVRENCTEFVTDCNSLQQLQRTARHCNTLRHRE